MMAAAGLLWWGQEAGAWSGGSGVEEAALNQRRAMVCEAWKFQGALGSYSHLLGQFQGADGSG